MECFLCATWAGVFAERVNGHHPACPRGQKPDLRRTVRAVRVQAFDPDGGAPNGLDYAAGSCQQVSPGRLMFTCPGCRQWGTVRCSAPKKPDTWEIVSGDLDRPESLTLAPSIHCIDCCGWHGYLRDGSFTPC